MVSKLPFLLSLTLLSLAAAATYVTPPLPAPTTHSPPVDSYSPPSKGPVKSYTPSPPIKAYTPPSPPPIEAYTPPPKPPGKGYTMPKSPAPRLGRPPALPYPPKAPAPPVVKSPTPTPYYGQGPPVKKQECGGLCEKRCTLHSRPQMCLRACTTCCLRCKCVPPGTYGNTHVCGRCYTEMKTHGGRPKCP